MPILKLPTISPMVGIFVYYKNMEITDSFQINLTSKEYDILQEMFTKVADLDLVEWSDEFSDLWDKVNDANHEIHFTEWARSPNSIQDS